MDIGVLLSEAVDPFLPNSKYEFIGELFSIGIGYLCPIVYGGMSNSV
ncbi:unnamed protein product [marine sediment metagenome]|uniref:Uncharacterized protein n=1 Tax=marine sediment metagenome TaxID=412755 RepID=X1H513_9ZZZZ